MSALREALESAMSDYEAPVESAPVEETASELDAEPTIEPSVTTESAEAEARARDEKGRFAAKQEETPQAVEQVQTEAVPEVPTRKAPSSWKPAAQEAFLKAERGEALSMEEIKLLTQEAERRENDFHKGVSEFKSHAERARSYEQAIGPFNGYLQQLGVDAPTAIRHLLKTEHTLRTADPVTKANEFARLAREYDVDLGQIQEPPQHDPQIEYLMKQIQDLQSAHQQTYNQHQQQELAKANSIVEQMASDVANFPHFEAVRGDMADLLEAGKAKSEKDAYEMAVWMRPDIRTTLLDQQRAEAQKKALEQAQRAKSAAAAAVSVKGSSPTSTGTQPVKGSLRDVIAAQFEN